MSHAVYVALFVLMASVLWWGRRIPLDGWRKRLAVGCRLAAVAALLLALFGPSRPRTAEARRSLVYLVDVSASIDASQRGWIARRIASLEARRPASLRRAVVAFGAAAQPLTPFQEDRLADPSAIERLLMQAEIGRDRTDVEAALLALPGLVPPRAPVGVVLLSDGRQTAGHVSRLLGSIRRLGLAVFPETPPLFGEAGTVWEELAVPPVVRQGAPVAVQLVVVNAASSAKPGAVTVAIEGVPVKRQRLTLRPGWQVVRVDVPAIGRGTMELEVRLAIPSEGLSESRRAYTEVEGPPHLLFVTEQTAALPALAAALKRSEMEVTPIRPADLSAPVEADAVVLFNIPKSSLSAAQAEALRAHVEQQGGGLVMLGLGGEWAEEIQRPASLDALLPVVFEPKGLKESKRRVCLILLIDRSASMLGPRIAATKRAAVTLVKQLDPQDLVGILAFDTQPYIVAEVQQAGQVASASLIEKLVKLRSSGGTDVFPALAAAESRLELTGASLKHIILLSDGNTPFHEEAYDALVRAFRLHGTTVSTIGIGAAFINTDFLEWLAKATGGAFYHLRRLDELPQLIIRDTQQQLGRLPFTEGLFRPAASPRAEWFEGIAAWPPLRGYLTAAAKPQARVELTIDGGEGAEPLLARWSRGQGRVVSFLSDADARWSPDWIRWDRFQAVWAQVLRWAMRPRLSEELFVWVDEGRAVPALVVEGRLADPHGELATGDGATAPLALVQVGPWRWEASLAHAPGGWHQCSLTARVGPEGGSGGSLVAAKRWVRIGSAASSQELAGQPPHEPLLRQLAWATGGAMQAPDAALVPPTVPVTVTEPPLGWWLPLVIILLLLDVWLRGSTML
jgi:Mg-chelatase subunit ChlD